MRAVEETLTTSVSKFFVYSALLSFWFKSSIEVNG